MAATVRDVLDARGTSSSSSQPCYRLTGVFVFVP